jgi:GNAT superfamily N-acetyltransferase
MRFTLRPAISDDAPEASRLLAQYGYRVDVRVVRGAFERAHGADDAQVIAVTDGDELVGLAVVAVAADRGRLQALFVSKTRRRQGVGRILLAAAEAVASARGCVLMEAGAAREGGRRFLRRAGFDDGCGRLVKPLAGVESAAPR